MANPLDLAYRKYHSQDNNCKKRGIEFKLTFDEWYDWWLSHGIDKNVKTTTRYTQGPKDPCMCRYNDIGAYELGNIYLDTRSGNSLISQRKRIQTPAGIFPSNRSAAEYYKVTPETIRNRIKRRPTEYFYV